MRTTIDLNRVRLFVRVVEAGSFTAAAAAAGLPKSSVSRSVSSLEHDLGVRLIQRTTRHLQVTEAGRAYFESVSRALAGIEEANTAVTEHKGAPRGTVRLTAPGDIGHALLAPSLARFRSLYPEVLIDVSLTQRRVDLVHEGFDLALRVGELADTSLVARRAGVVRAALFASREYLAQRGTPRSVAELAQHDCLLFRSASGRAAWEMVGPAGMERAEVRGALSSDDHHMILEAAVEGQGIALLPVILCRVAGDRLERVLPQHATTGAVLSLLTPTVRFVPKRVSLLREQLLEELPELLS